MKRRNFLGFLAGAAVAAREAFVGDVEAEEAKQESQNTCGHTYTVMLLNGPMRLYRGDYFKYGDRGTAKRCRQSEAIGISINGAQPYAWFECIITYEGFTDKGKVSISDSKQRDS